MWISQKPLHKFKISIHLFQAVLTFVTACLTLAILTEKGRHDSRVDWCFALCFLTMPVLIYQCIVPCWTRLWRFANPKAYFFIDFIYTIFWISAFASITAWNAAGMKAGAADEKNSGSGSCSTFAYGSASKCKLAQATTGFGVVLCLLFVAAGSISGPDAYRFWMAGETTHRPEIYGQTAQNKDEWSTSTQELDTDYKADSLDFGDDRQHSIADSTETKEGRHPGRQISCSSVKTIPYEKDFTPSAMSPTTSDGRLTMTRPFPTMSYSFSDT